MAAPSDRGTVDHLRVEPDETAEPLRPEPVGVGSGAPWPDLLLHRLAGRDRRRLAGLGAALLLAVGTAVAGYALVRTPPPPATELLLPYAETNAANAPVVASTTTTAPAEVLVHAAGAVAVPGVHRLPSGSRVSDLLTAAGGPVPDTDLDRVNLAAPLVDGERVWFPRMGEEATPPVVGGAGAASPADGGVAGPADQGPIDLNTATAEQLDTLPGVGPATAAAILEHRQRQGPFRTVDELLDVPGIGDAKLAQLRDLVTV